MRTIGELQACPPDELVRRFGESHGRGLHQRAHFRDDSPVAPPEAKSRSVESTFDYDIADLARARGDPRRAVAAAGGELRERAVRGRTIGIKVRLDDWTTFTRVHTIDAPTNDPETIAAMARTLLRAYAPPRPVRLIGVKVAAFAEPARGARAAEPAPGLEAAKIT